MLGFTHMIFAFALVKLMKKNEISGVIFALMPEIDILLDHITPFVRNGIFHSLMAVIVITSLIEAIFADRDITEGTLIGFSSHIMLDILSFDRIMIFFPIQSFYSLDLLATYGLMENLAVISVSIMILLESENPTVSRLISRKVRSVLTLK